MDSENLGITYLVYLIYSLQKTLWVHGADISLVSSRNSDLPCRRQVRELQKTLVLVKANLNIQHLECGLLKGIFSPNY